MAYHKKERRSAKGSPQSRLPKSHLTEESSSSEDGSSSDEDVTSVNKRTAQYQAARSRAEDPSHRGDNTLAPKGRPLSMGDGSRTEMLGSALNPDSKSRRRSRPAHTNTWGRSIGNGLNYLNPFSYFGNKPATQSSAIQPYNPQQPGIFSSMGTFLYTYTGARFAWSWTGGAIQQRRLDAYDAQPDSHKAILDVVNYLQKACQDAMPALASLITQQDIQSDEAIDPVDQQRRIDKATIEQIKADGTTKPRVFTLLSKMKADHKDNLIGHLHTISNVYATQTTGSSAGKNPNNLAFLQFACNLAQDIVMDFVSKQNYVMSSAAVVKRTLQVSEIKSFARVSGEVDTAQEENHIVAMSARMDNPINACIKAQGNLDPSTYHYAKDLPDYSLVKSNADKSGNVTSYEYQMSTKRGELFDKIRAEASVYRPKAPASVNQTDSHKDAVNEMAGLREAITQEIVNGPG